MTLLSKELSHYDLIYVEWVDSYGCGSQWGVIPDKDPVSHYCYSVGWAVKESVDALVLVPHISPRNEDIEAEESGCGDMTIPIVSIVRRLILKATPMTKNPKPDKIL